MDNLINLRKDLIKQAEGWDKLNPKSIQTLIMAGLGGLAGGMLLGPIGGLGGLLAGAYFGTLHNPLFEPDKDKPIQKSMAELYGLTKPTPEENTSTAMTYAYKKPPTEPLRFSQPLNSPNPEKDMTSIQKFIFRGGPGFLDANVDPYGHQTYNKLSTIEPGGVIKSNPTQWGSNIGGMVEGAAFSNPFTAVPYMAYKWIAPQEWQDKTTPDKTPGNAKAEGIVGALASIGYDYNKFGFATYPTLDPITKKPILDAAGKIIPNKLGGYSQLGMGVAGQSSTALYVANKLYQGLMPESIQAPMQNFDEGMTNWATRKLLEHEYKTNTNADYHKALDTFLNIDNPIKYTKDFTPEDFIKKYDPQIKTIHDKYKGVLSYEDIASTLATWNMGERDEQGHLKYKIYLNPQDRSVDKWDAQYTSGIVHSLANLYEDPSKLLKTKPSPYIQAIKGPIKWPLAALSSIANLGDNTSEHNNPYHFKDKNLQRLLQRKLDQEYSIYRTKKDITPTRNYAKHHNPYIKKMDEPTGNIFVDWGINGLLSPFNIGPTAVLRTADALKGFWDTHNENEDTYPEPIYPMGGNAFGAPEETVNNPVELQKFMRKK